MTSDREEGDRAPARWRPWIAALLIVAICSLFWAGVAAVLRWRGLF